jgi:hypothetical protein
MSAPTCPLVRDFEPDEWHIAGPVWAVRWPPQPSVWVLLHRDPDGRESYINFVGHATRRDAVRAYWAGARLGRP